MYCLFYFILTFILLHILSLTKQIAIKDLTYIIKSPQSHKILNGYNSGVKYILVFNNKEKKNLINKNNISSNILLLEHNMEYDDLLFLIPLYSILIKTNYVAICNNYYKSLGLYNKIHIGSKYNYSVIKNCIHFNVNYIKLLHIHTNYFRNCSFDYIYSHFNQYNVLLKRISNVCEKDDYYGAYSVVTTLYRRNYINTQLKFLFNQTFPPKHIIVVHDRNFRLFYNNYSNIIYIHTINFEAGFFFRYLIAILSPENNVLIYDDDFLPGNNNMHKEWITDIRSSQNKIYCHRMGAIKRIKWCATPLIVKRKFLYLQWIYHIYEESQAEDGHLSFSVLLLCNITCAKKEMKGFLKVSDNLSSPRKKIKRDFWYNYVKFIYNDINSYYINNLKYKYLIS